MPSTSTEPSLETRRPPMQDQALVLAKDFVSFIKRPTRRHPRRANLATAAGAILTLLALNALFSGLVCLPIALVLRRMIGLASRQDVGTGVFIVAALAIAPCMEELMFRAGMRGARWTVFGLPVVAAMFLSEWRVVSAVASLSAAAWLLDHIRQRRLSAQAFIRSRWQRGRTFVRNYALVVYAQAALFAAIHIPNFVFDAGAGWMRGFVVLVVMSQLMGALVFSYLRLRHGLRSAMVAHFSWNACAVGLALLGG